MTKPTHQDANLMLQLYQVWAEMELSEAVGWIWSDEFIPDHAELVSKYPPGSEGYGKASKLCHWFETLGTLYKHGLFNEELLFDWLAVGLVWERLKGFPLGLREDAGDPRLYENFEAMANAEKEQ